MDNESNGTSIQGNLGVTVEDNASKPLSQIEEKFKSLSLAVDDLNKKLDKFDEIKFNSIHDELNTLTNGFEKLKNSLGSNNALKGFASAARTNAAANVTKANAYEKSVNNRKEESQTRFDRDFKILEQNDERLQIEKKNADTREFEALSRDSERQEKLELAKDKNFQQQYKLLLQEEHFAKELERKIKETEEKLKIQASNSNAKNTRANAALLNAQTNQQQQAYRDFLKESKKRDLDYSAELKKARLEALKNSQNRYTNDFTGGLASVLSRANSRMNNRGGIIGGLSRIGTRMAASGRLGGVLGAGTLSGAGVNVGGLALGGLAIALNGATKAVIEFSKASIDAYASMQKIATNLEVVMGSRTESDKVFSDIKNYAITSPFGVQQTAEMAILLKQSGVSASKLQTTLEMIGDVSSGNAEKMKRIANNYAQIQAIGHASMLDMRQFAYAGLPIYEEVAKYMNVSQRELRSMISDGKVTSEVIEEVFKGMTGEGGTFYKSVEKGAKTIEARRMNLEDKKTIAMSNWGDWLYNSSNVDSRSIYSIILDIKEGVYGIVANTGETAKINQDEKRGESQEKILNQLIERYIEAEENGNEKLAELIKKTYDSVTSSKFNFDEVRASYVKAFEKRNSLKGNRVSDEFMRSLISDSRTLASETLTPEMQNFLAGKSDSDLMEFLRHGGLIYASQHYSPDASNDYIAQTLTETADSVVAEKDYQKAIEDYYQKGGHERSLAIAAIISDIQNFSKQGIDALNDLEKSSNSLSSLNSKYKEMWKGTKEAQEQTKTDDEKKYNETKELFSQMKELYDYDNNSLKAGITSNQLNEFFRSGFANFKTLEINTESLSSTNSSSDENWKAIQNNVTQVLKTIEGLDSSAYTQDLISIEKQLKSLEIRIPYYWKNNRPNEFIKNFNDIIKIIRESDDETLKNLGTMLVSKMSADSDFAKNPFSDSGNGNDFIPLWKRIISNATGWSTDFIKSESDFMEDFNKLVDKNIASGGIQGLVNSGASLEKILSRLEYTDSKNSQGVRQIDWRKSSSSLLRDALSGGSARESSSILQGLSSSINTQLDTFNKLKTDMLTVGEDWTTITQSLKGQFGSDIKLGKKNIYDNAFGFLNEESKEYNVKFDDNGILSVFDSNGALVGSVEELKKTEDSLKAPLKDFVKKIKFDSIIKPLDEAVASLNGLAAVVNVSNSIAQKTLDLQNETARNRGKILGSNLGAIRNIPGTPESFFANPYFDYTDSSANTAIARKAFENPEQYKDIIDAYENEIVESIKRTLENFKAAGGVLTPEEEQEAIRSQKEIIDYRLYSAGMSYDEIEDYFSGVYDWDKILSAGNKKASSLYSGSVYSEETEKVLTDFLSDFISSVADIDNANYKEMEKLYKEINKRVSEDGSSVEFNKEIYDSIMDVRNSLDSENIDYSALEKLMQAFGVSMKDLMQAAQDYANSVSALEVSKGADTILSRLPSRSGDPILKKIWLQPGNSFSDQSIMNAFGLQGRFKDYSRSMTGKVLADPSKYPELAEKYRNAAENEIKSSNLSDDEKNEKLQELKEAFDSKDFGAVKGVVSNFDKLTESINKSAISSQLLKESFVDLGKSIGGALEQFTSSAITSTMSTWGESIATSADASEAIGDNFRKLGAELASNLGSMMVQAGLAMIIDGIGNKKQMLAGLALAAAGGGLSFISGYMGAESDSDDDTDSDYERLLRIKEDLTDLLKQAREDSIYYENQTRHGNALAVNSSLGKSTKVNDAIITPSGNVISTHPDDYLIATKTPETLTRGGGAPTINFSVVDKSTGVKVTKQTSKYNKEDNSIDFEAIIESKVTEIIAGSKGDEAFNIRAARQAGVTYVG